MKQLFQAMLSPINILLVQTAFTHVPFFVGLVNALSAHLRGGAVGLRDGDEAG